MRRRVLLALIGSLMAVSLQAATPYLVKEINENIAPASSYPDDFLPFGSLVLFTTNDYQGTPRELWRTDGTSAGTFKLAGVPESVVVWNGKAWFTSGGLWSTDGTVAGTQKLTLPVATPALAPTHLMAGPAHLYFFNAGRLWRTDGTTAGTAQLTTGTLRPGRWFSYPNLPWSAVLAGSLYFFADSDASGTELWKADATGTLSQVKDLITNGAGNLTVAGNLLYLTRYRVVDSIGAWELWRSDGTSGGTIPLKSAQPIVFNEFDGYIASGSLVYFSGNDGTGRKLWRTNGTDAGTVAVATSLPGAATNFDADPIGRLSNGTILLRSYVVLGGVFDVGLWAYDGTNVTFLVQADSPGNAARRATSAGAYALYGKGDQIWRTDGTIGGTYSLGTFRGSNGYANWPMIALGTKVLFGAMASVHGAELWITEGTVGTAAMVKDIVEGTFGSNPDNLTPFRGGILFDASSDDVEGDQPETRDLWFSDGTAAGTTKVLAGQDANEMVPCGSRAFFTRSGGPAVGWELWATDGTTAGTAFVKDLFPGIEVHTDQPNSSNPTGFLCLDGVVLFYTSAYPVRELWRSDGTAAGTLLVRSFGPAYNDFEAPTPLVRFGHAVYFGSRTDYTGRLWRSDGTPGGTAVVKDLPEVSIIEGLKTAGNYLYMSASDSGGGFNRSLWRSDGTAAGTVRIRTGSSLGLIADFYGRLTYGWRDNATNTGGICTTGGGPTTCFEPADEVGSYFFSMVPMNGRLYYNHPDLRSTDGATELRPGVGDFDRILTTGGGLLYATGDLFLHSGYSHLLESDGTPGGTRVLMENAYDASAVSSGGRVFIATDELYALASDITPTGFSPASVAVPGGQTVTIAGRGFSGPVTVKVGGVNATVGAVTPTSIAFTAPVQIPGSYEIELTLAGDRRFTLDQPLTYTCTATAAATAPAAGVCPLTPVTLQGSGGSRCAWFPATGLDDPSSCTPKATVAVTTTYRLIVFTADGCPSTNNATATVNVFAPPDATITVPVPGNTLEANKSYTASVPDAGAGATYVWTATGLTITSSPAARTITFTTSCWQYPKLLVTVTSGSGCVTKGERLFILPTMELRSLSPTLVNPGTVVTITGTGLDCVPPLQLRGSVTETDTATTIPLVLTKIDGKTVQFRFPANALRQSVVEPQSYLGYQPIRNYTLYRSGPVDFNGSSTSDIFWRNSVTGETSTWMMSYTTFTGLASTPMPPSWTLGAFGDFSGDGRADIIWYNPTTGETKIWLMNGAKPSVIVPSTRVPVNWKPVGAGDFNRDGKSDVFWHNPNTGETSVWFMNGTTATSMVRSITVPVGWRPVAFGDFNADGYGDIFWRRATSGETSIWLMTGTGMPGTTVRSTTLAAPWTVAGSSDFNGDRKDDLFWHNPTTGQTTIWHLNGIATPSTTAGLTMTGFVPVAAGHMDGGGIADVLWYNPTTGETALWLRYVDATTGQVIPMLRVKDRNWKPVIVP